MIALQEGERLQIIISQICYINVALNTGEKFFQLRQIASGEFFLSSLSFLQLV